jgi:predicted Fe-Mo cluster-binding NifX family protein
MTSSQVKEGFMEIRFAIPTSNGILATHFHQTHEASIIDVKDNQIENIQSLNLPSCDSDELANWFEELKVDVLIVRGIHCDMLDAINHTRVNVRTGTESDTPENLVNKFLNRSLKVEAITRDTN